MQGSLFQGKHMALPASATMTMSADVYKCRLHDSLAMQRSEHTLANTCLIDRQANCLDSQGAVPM